MREGRERAPAMKLALILACLATCPAVLAAPNAEVADAAQRGNKAAVRTLVQKKADVNAAQADGSTALHWAVQADDLETVDLLLKAGAKVGAATREGVQPMQLAAINGNAAASSPRSVDTPLTAYDIVVAAMRKMPSEARVMSMPSGLAMRSWIARCARTRSSCISPPKKRSAPSRPSTRFASVTVGFTPPLP